MIFLAWPKIQEQYMLSAKKSWKSSNTDYNQSSVWKSPQSGSILGTPKTWPLAKLPYQKVSESQMQEWHKKGLYYFCDEKWQQDHICLKPKLLLLEGT